MNTFLFVDTEARNIVVAADDDDYNDGLFIVFVITGYFYYYSYVKLNMLRLMLAAFHQYNMLNK